MATTSSTSSEEKYEFQPPPVDAVRSPCPALNALASHGYIPRSGRNLSFLQLYNAIRAVYNTSAVLTFVLTLTGFLLCGHNARPTIPFIGTVDLCDFALHGGIEHDASLVHADAAPGELYAPTTPDTELLEELLQQAHDDKDILELPDFAKVRSRRDGVLALHNKKLSFFHAELSRGEIALILSVIGDGESVSAQSLRDWMGKERLPEGWRRPEKSRGLVETIRMARRVDAAVNVEKQSSEEALGISKKE